MARWMAIDLGKKRTGIAVTDPLQIIATPLTTVSTHEVYAYIKEYILREEVEYIVVGMPLKEDNTDTHMTSQVRQFVRYLEKNYPEKKIFTEDERYTSKMALEAMITAGSTKKDRRDKGNLDKISAAIILQSFMDRMKRQTSM
ncbi:MAG: Holliday junction resolvase RuvX [Cyclobacteriaceae bacterium]|nr:Holliday junction resolvase RuvX [Cyclobacteriaceae bacterium]